MARNRFLADRVSLFICFALFIGTIALYASVRHFDFLNYDDGDYVIENQRVLDGLSLQNAQWALTHVYASNWHPLTWLSHMLDVEIWGKKPGGHHLTNVFLHALNAVLLFLLLRSITGKPGRDSTTWRSAFVAGVFAWHPLHVESVAWISERKDLLCTLFWLLTIAAYVRNIRAPRPRGYVLMLVLFACALMSKPMAVTLPFLLLLIDYWPLRRAVLVRSNAPKLMSLVIEKIPLFILAALSCVVTFWVQHSTGATRSFSQVPLSLRAANIPISYFNYVWETVWPVRLAPFYPFPTHIPFRSALLSALVLSILTAFAFFAAKRRPYVAVGWLWFIGCLIPVIGLVQVGDQSMADRYMYIPLIGLAIIVAWGANELAQRWSLSKGIIGAAGLTTLAACVVATANQIPYWRDNFAFYRRALHPGHYDAGHPFFYDGLTDALLHTGQLTEADTVMAQARAHFPDNPKRLNLAGKIKFQMGSKAEAERLWNRALELAPNEYETHNNLGILYSETARRDEARREFERLLQLRPDDAIALGNLAQLCLLTKDYADAQRYCERALTIAPNDPMLRALKTQIEKQQWNEP